MLIHSAGQLLTLAGSPQRGAALGSLGIMDGGATSELRKAHPTEELLDAGGRVVMPGFVDAHSHPIWAGDRAAEFELRLQGKSYLEILTAGGGILSTVRPTP